MLGEIIRELTKIYENTEITSENVLCWAKRVEGQRPAIMNSLAEAKELDKLKIVKSAYRDSFRRSSAQTNAHKTVMQILWYQPFPKTMPGLWEEMHRVQ